jgi:hypothetical protein
MPCGGKKRRRGEKGQVFGVGYSTHPVDHGEVEPVMAGRYPEFPQVELPDHLKPSYLRPRELDQLKQP